LFNFVNGIARSDVPQKSGVMEHYAAISIALKVLAVARALMRPEIENPSQNKSGRG
jgi:hypothetical protein